MWKIFEIDLTSCEREEKLVGYARTLEQGIKKAKKRISVEENETLHVYRESDYASIFTVWHHPEDSTNWMYTQEIQVRNEP